jgi:hypothetical protein
MDDGNSIIWPLLALFVVVVIGATWAWLGQVDTSNGAVIAITEAQHIDRRDITTGGDVDVVILSSLAASAFETGAALCVGACAGWLLLALICIAILALNK